jgi:hypothetical protein
MNLQYVILRSDGTSYAVDHQAAFFKWGQQPPHRFDLGKCWLPAGFPFAKSRWEAAMAMPVL